MIPFAVVGSDQEYQINGRRILGRKTKWGTIEGKGPHSEFLLFQSFLTLNCHRYHLNIQRWQLLYAFLAFVWAWALLPSAAGQKENLSLIIVVKCAAI